MICSQRTSVINLKASDEFHIARYQELRCQKTHHGATIDDTERVMHEELGRCVFSKWELISYQRTTDALKRSTPPITLFTIRYQEPEKRVVLNTMIHKPHR